MALETYPIADCKFGRRSSFNGICHTLLGQTSADMTSPLRPCSGNEEALRTARMNPIHAFGESLGENIASVLVLFVVGIVGKGRQMPGGNEEVLRTAQGFSPNGTHGKGHDQAKIGVHFAGESQDGSGAPLGGGGDHWTIRIMITPALQVLDSKVQNGRARTAQQKVKESTSSLPSRNGQGKPPVGKPNNNSKKSLKQGATSERVESTRRSPGAPTVDVDGFREVLDIVHSRLEGCSTGRPSCDSCKRGFLQDAVAMESVLSKCAAPTLKSALQQAESIPQAPRLLATRTSTSYFLRAVATLQLKYAVQVYRARVIDSDSSDYCLKQAGADDPTNPVYSQDLHHDVQKHLFSNLDMFDELFQTDFGLLYNLGIEATDVPAWLGAHNILNDAFDFDSFLVLTPRYLSDPPSYLRSCHGSTTDPAQSNRLDKQPYQVYPLSEYSIKPLCRHCY
ncbi:hypothetical protein BKA70DRAFT_1218103 [Coprinopsis sp. MPI-PUGE-AT-0042]|nr:hypothetical protein BKA70DRAFT_1218103 [Coprinopsis sp. MPI-PUGE-AT-0042]